MNVVFDTNVLVSALVFPGGRADAAIVRVIDGVDRLFLSREIVTETLSVLASKFSRDEEELARFAIFLSDLATIVAPSRRISVLRDEPDNRILECAVAAKADAIVTGDKAMLALRSHLGTRILTLADYLDGETPHQP